MPVSQPPPAVPDLDWSSDRAREFGDRILDLYTSLLAELPDGPVSPPLSTEGVRHAVALDVPEEPIGDDALLVHLRAIVDQSIRPGSGGFLAYISGAGTVPGALADILAHPADYYVNVHTAAFPKGAMRGQLA